MPTTGQVTGLLIKIYTGTAPGTAISCQTEASLEIGVNMTDTTCKDTAPGWDAAVASRKNWSISGTAFFSFDASNGFSQLFGFVTAGTSVLVRITTGVTGDKLYSGQALIESLSLSAGLDDTASYDFSFKGVGALTESTV